MWKDNSENMPPRIYLETTIFNYYFLKDIHRKNNIKVTQFLFDKIKKGFFEPYTSGITIAELAKCPDISLKNNMFDLINEYNIPVLSPEKYKYYQELAEK